MFAVQVEQELSYKWQFLRGRVWSLLQSKHLGYCGVNISSPVSFSVLNYTQQLEWDHRHKLLQEVFFPKGGTPHSPWRSENLSLRGETGCGDTTPRHWGVPLSDQNAEVPPFRGRPGTSDCEETQNPLKRLYLLIQYRRLDVLGMSRPRFTFFFFFFYATLTATGSNLEISLECFRN